MGLDFSRKPSMDQLKLKGYRKEYLLVVEECLELDAGAHGNLGELRLADRELLEEKGSVEVGEKD